MASSKSVFKITKPPIAQPSITQPFSKDITQMSQICYKHNEKYTIYCKKHECPCCSGCIVEDHNECRNLAKLADFIKKNKPSNAFSETEHSLEELVNNIKAVRHDQQNNLQRLAKMKSKIFKEIKETRITINNHLDEIQNDILEKLNAVEEEENTKIVTLLLLLKEKENEISECQKSMGEMKKNAKDLKSYLLMKYFENEVSSKGEFLQSMIDTENIQERNLSYKAHAAIQSLVIDINNFGAITVETKPSNVVIKRRNFKEEQLLVPSLSTVHTIELNLTKTIDSTGDNTWGCCTFPDGRLAFPDYYSKTIRVFNTDGSFSFDVKTATCACDIAYISEDNTLAVSSGGSDTPSISLIDIQNKQMKETIPVGSYCYGIAIKDNELICSAADDGIQVIDMFNNSTSDIVSEQIPSGGYVATFGHKVYHTNNETNCVTCLDLHGIDQWAFQNENVLKEPRGISVDNDGNVYVVGVESFNVVVISADGKQYKELFIVSDDLFEPYTLDYNKETNQLLVADNSNKAMLFDVGH
ncbi:unnamed protein product [Mytilus edulis]|uniref:B box-type domain-containing protein n=1 Tax=Mytilus edulis TaxID=6550 RepID=A0A8S3U715_MYTED|nr:unnamed protein product [Mytilus edulis]